MGYVKNALIILTSVAAIAAVKDEASAQYCAPIMRPFFGYYFNTYRPFVARYYTVPGYRMLTHENAPQPENNLASRLDSAEHEIKNLEAEVGRLKTSKKEIVVRTPVQRHADKGYEINLRPRNELSLDDFDRQMRNYMLAILEISRNYTNRGKEFELAVDADEIFVAPRSTSIKEAVNGLHTIYRSEYLSVDTPEAVDAINASLVPIVGDETLNHVRVKIR